MNKPAATIVKHAQQICDGIEVDDGTSYRPANSTEGFIFEEHWCGKCKKGKNCSIWQDAFCGGQPTQWFYWNGAPLCSAWKDKDAPSKPRKPKPTPLLDWLEEQAPQEDLGSDWLQEVAPQRIDELEVVMTSSSSMGTIVPASSESSLEVGDLVRCLPIFRDGAEGEGRRVWGGWEGEIESIEGEYAFVQFGEFPLYKVRLARLEWAEDAEVIQMMAETQPDSSAFKEWRFWGETGLWTYTGFMGMSIEPRFENSHVFPANVNPNQV